MNLQFGFYHNSFLLSQGLFIIHKLKEVSFKDIFSRWRLFTLDVDLGQSFTFGLELTKVKLTGRIFQCRNREYILSWVGVGVFLIEKTGEVEGKVEEVFHIMSENIVTNVLAILELFVKNTNSYFELGLLILGHQNDQTLRIRDILLQSFIIVEVYDLFWRQLQKFVDVTGKFFLLNKMLIHLKLRVGADVGTDLLLVW